MRNAGETRVFRALFVFLVVFFVEEFGEMSKRREKKTVQKERDSEDWCFVCKDGGSLILCDYKDCLKVYHPSCVGKDTSDSENVKQWTCKWHFCDICGTSSQLFCLCCPNAVCKCCVASAKFACLKGNKGLCGECLELVMVLEEHEEYSCDGDEIDLTDRDTHECLFFEYWEIIKQENDLTLNDVYAADSRIKKGVYLTNNENAKLSIVDSRDEDAEDCKLIQKRKRLEFVGWGSKPLIDFLASIGIDTTEELSAYEVESIISRYIHEKRLLHPQKKRRVVCDEKLRSIFRRKLVHKHRIHSLLDAHFTANVQSEDDDVDLGINHGSRVKDVKTMVACKKQKTVSSGEMPPQENVRTEIRLSPFASIVADNIKLVYLRRSLVEQLLEEKENFVHELVGSYVKVKTDPRDYTQRNHYQILPVAAARRIPGAGTKSDVLLQVPYVPYEVCISKLLDSDINQEEIEDLRRKINSGLLKKPTVVEIEQKAKALHEDIIKHWIARELIVLQNRIDHANEKGWRREMCEYLERRELLKQPAEQERLLKREPKVIAEVIEVKSS